MTEHVRVTVAERVTEIELLRPEKKNALTGAMYDAMSEAIARTEGDPELRVALLHGQPDCFTSGNDLADFLAAGTDPARGVDFPAARFLSAIRTARKPLVAAVGGVAVGIGTTMLLHCELVYAAPGSRFQMPFVPLGLAPEGGSSLLLPLAAGHARAAELLLLGRPFGPEKAVAAGIVNEIVPEDRLLATAREAARALAALPAESVRITKEWLRRPHAAALEERMAEELRVFGERLHSPEARAALARFFDRKRG
ncbi:MAG TPA: enoyl-CoA hydratase-related protein [Anaeromyxobacteraceae bacterium]|nr:enoyl-CoA hydratase-related protein [Anaeromyxobacteraceae bacterium]